MRKLIEKINKTIFVFAFISCLHCHAQQLCQFHDNEYKCYIAFPENWHSSNMHVFHRDQGFVSFLSSSFGDEIPHVVFGDITKRNDIQKLNKFIESNKIYRVFGKVKNDSLIDSANIKFGYDTVVTQLRLRNNVYNKPHFNEHDGLSVNVVFFYFEYIRDGVVYELLLSCYLEDYDKYKNLFIEIANSVILE